MKNFKKNISSDIGAGVTILSLGILFIIFAVAILMVDFNKNIYMKNQYEQIATRSAQIGLKEQNNVGGLNSTAAQKVVDEYFIERDGKLPSDGSSLNSKIENLTNTPTNETKSFRNTCSANSEYLEYPIITVSFHEGRVDKDGVVPSFTYKNGNWVDSDPNQFNPAFVQKKYDRLEVTVKDFGDNYFFSILGKPCSEYNISTSAITIEEESKTENTK